MTTSNHNLRFLYGYTLIEMNVVLIVLLLMALMIVPTFSTMQNSRNEKDQEAAILRAPLEAGNDARKNQEPIRLRINGDALIMERISSTSDAQEIKRLTLAQNSRVTGTISEGATVDSAIWEWKVYPDGTSDSGGVEFEIGPTRRTLLLNRDGSARWETGGLNQVDQESWPAGELAQNE